MSATLEEHLKVQPRDGEDSLTILLVDDDPDCRMLVRDAIGASKVRSRVFEADSAEEALRFLRRQGSYSEAPRPRLIYLDIEMPGLNGIDLLRQIKQDPELRHITVVMMTGVSDDNQLRSAADAGANSYTIKPANAEHFLRTVIDSARYWLTIHQYPEHHLPRQLCRR